MLAKRSLLIGTFVFEQILMFRPIGLTLRAAPALATRVHPALLRRGIIQQFATSILVAAWPRYAFCGYFRIR
jgi:type III secretory pathway component EscT